MIKIKFEMPNCSRQEWAKRPNSPKQLEPRYQIYLPRNINPKIFTQKKTKGFTKFHKKENICFTKKWLPCYFSTGGWGGKYHAKQCREASWKVIIIIITIIITIIEIIREGKLQEMESRAEKLEQGTVIFQVGAAIPPPILNKDSSSHPHVTNMLPSCHPPATLMSPHVILLPSSCNPPNISSRASSFLKSSWPQN